MFVADVAFPALDGLAVDDEHAAEAIDSVLAAMRMNGQIWGREWALVRARGAYRARLMLPAADALAEQHHNSWVRASIQALPQVGLAAPSARLLGREIESSGCVCADPSAYVLYTYDRMISMPLMCGDCFCPVPLYRIPPIRNDEYWDIVTWQTSYQACDELRGLVGPALDALVRRELFELTSDLCLKGRTICDAVTSLAGVPTYYALYRYGTEVELHEQAWLCPGCQGRWFVDEEWHDFDFVCHICRLVSTKPSERG